MKRSLALLALVFLASCGESPTTPTVAPTAAITSKATADPLPAPAVPAVPVALVNVPGDPGPVPPVGPLDLSCKTRQREVSDRVRNGADISNGFRMFLVSSQKWVYVEPGPLQDCGCRIVDVYPDVNWCQLPGYVPSPSL